MIEGVNKSIMIIDLKGFTEMASTLAANALMRNPKPGTRDSGKQSSRGAARVNLEPGTLNSELDSVPRHFTDPGRFCARTGAKPGRVRTKKTREPP